MKYRADWDLWTIPNDVFYAEVSRRRGLKGGRPVVLKQCEWCKAEMSAREFQRHSCPVKKRAKQLK